MDTLSARHFHDIFIGDSEMARLMREHDWASTSLGPAENWPNALKVALRLLLTSRFEMWLGWGPDINFFYNDAYIPTLGTKHPKSLGVPTKELWAEIWDDIQGRLATVYEEGQATWDRALLLVLERHGYPEETYHTFSYSPLIGDSGEVEGVFCAVSEETERVLNERRMDTLRQLAFSLSAAKSRPAVFEAACIALGENLKDLPFSLLYEFDEDGSARRRCANQMGDCHPLSPAVIDGTSGLWDLCSAWNNHATLVVDIPEGSSPPMGAWDKPPKRAAIVPLLGQGGGRPEGVLICGLNPYLQETDHYIDFLKLAAGQIASALASVIAFEAEQRRSVVLAEAARLKEEVAAKLEQLNRQLADEVQVRKAEAERMRDLFQQAPSFMAILAGPDHVFELTNDAYLQLVGHRDLLGLPVRQALPDIEGQGFYELLDDVFWSGKPYIGKAVPVTLKRSADTKAEERFVNLIYQPIFDSSGTVTGIFVDGFDVTHQKRAEEQLQQMNQSLEQRVRERTEELHSALDRLQEEVAEREQAEQALRQAQKMEALGKLTGGVAHDFNNLLQVVSGNLQLLSKDLRGNAAAERRVQNALAGVSRGSKLAAQLLAFGRRQPLEPKVVDVRKLIQNMDDMLRRALGEEIELETVMAGGLWNCQIDPGQLENAILNLAINARDAMDGQGRLTIETGNSMLDDAYALAHEDVKPGQYVMVAVTDTGSGIDPAILERVIEPFFSTKGEGKGSGLGLSMVYGFVKQSGGHLKIYSEVGHGTTIRIYLPRVHQVEDALEDVRNMPVTGGTETILVVEDDDEVRETSVALLTDLGYRVLKANDAQAAYAIISSGIAIDLLFTDVVMPGPMRSPELARRAKEMLPGIAVLFTSGYTENSIVHGGRLDPGVDLLSKPYSREALARKVRQVLGNQAQHKVAETQEPAAVADLLTPAYTAECLRVLVVEDDELIRASTVDMLVASGHTVFEAADAPCAIDILRNQTVDVLLTDVGLPGISGVQLARDAKETIPAIGIVFASGDDVGRHESGIKDAVQLTKPYLLEDLLHALNGFRRR
ncbi:hybrid sensor histidine kinase/response regulator [Neorhizobium sp. SOG26]|uniref:hybrid sensor histidine kinase/response regulator n=1 Tax=Neorhizobium sp. SOG26 TaxID=2060726 RepID=UPI001FE01423|nr:response regulator [Neorhizobium sp. SOG26]